MRVVERPSRIRVLRGRPLIAAGIPPARGGSECEGLVAIGD